MLFLPESEMDSPSGDVVVGNIIGSSVVEESSDSVVASSCWSPDPSSGVSSVWPSKNIYLEYFHPNSYWSFDFDLTLRTKNVSTEDLPSVAAVVVLSVVVSSADDAVVVDVISASVVVLSISPSVVVSSFAISFASSSATESFIASKASFKAVAMSLAVALPSVTSLNMDSAAISKAVGSGMVVSLTAISRAAETSSKVEFGFSINKSPDNDISITANAICKTDICDGEVLLFSRTSSMDEAASSKLENKALNEALPNNALSTTDDVSLSTPFKSNIILGSSVTGTSS